MLEIGRQFLKQHILSPVHVVIHIVQLWRSGRSSTGRIFHERRQGTVACWSPEICNLSKGADYSSPNGVASMYENMMNVKTKPGPGSYHRGDA